MFDEQLSTIPSPGAGSFASATQWIEGLLTGSIGMTIGVVAIAIIGIKILQGQLAIRRGTKAIFGCFVLFGAPPIAQSLMPTPTPQAIAPIAVPAQKPAVIVTGPSPSSSDPYAGASVPFHGEGWK